MIKDEEAADTLDAAADYLRVHGWRQGTMGGPSAWDGKWYPACLIGSINVVDGNWSDPNSIYRLALKRVVGTPAVAIWIWNDTPGRTKDEVIDALMEAAVMCREGFEP